MKTEVFSSNGNAAVYVHAEDFFIGDSAGCDYPPFIGITIVLKRMSMIGDALSHASLAGVLSGYVKSSANFNSFLFGSIVSVSREELLLICLISVIVFLVLAWFYREFLYIAFDENAARISGVSVQKLNFMFTLLTALTVSVASRTVGTLIISSMLVVPIACGIQFGRSYFHTLIWAIVLLEVICFLFSVLYRSIRK